MITAKEAHEIVLEYNKYESTLKRISSVISAMAHSGNSSYRMSAPKEFGEPLLQHLTKLGYHCYIKEGILYIDWSGV